VGLDLGVKRRYPHELSGGQLRRVTLARVLVLEPRVVILDEPTSGLDLSVQATVLRLLRDLRERLGLTYLFISRDLSVVRLMCNRVAIMYLGRVVELAERGALFENPLHPYTRALLSAVPHPDPDLERARERIVLQGDVPSPSAPPTGCAFHPRCPERERVAGERCSLEVPVLTPREPGPRSSACHLG